MKGEDIPLGARIISIADAYDTMTTLRTYRDMVSQEEAVEELRRCSGTQFDPYLVEAFCRATTEAARLSKTHLSILFNETPERDGSPLRDIDTYRVVCYPAMRTSAR